MGLPYFHDENFALTAVLNADAMLNLPDFRAAEKSFRLFYRLAVDGSSRKSNRKVVIQSFNTDHYSLRWAAKLDYKGFYGEEIERREELGYPPLNKMIAVRVEGGPDSGADQLAASIVRMIKDEAPLDSDISVMGPVTINLARTRTKTRWQILIKGTMSARVERLARTAIQESAPRRRRTGSVRVSVDVDPVSFY
jgi:primosomal protein N' (replication factor Y)